MDVILLERVEKLGQMGDIVTVKNGYARNFLLPRGKALRATDGNKAYFESRRKEIEAQNLERKKEAEGVAKTMAGTHVILIRQAGESGQLYGSVTARDIAAALADAGTKVDKGQVVMEKPIKTLGISDVKVRLHAEVDVTVEVNVARSQGEAETQRETGRAVVGFDDDIEDDEELTAEALVEELLEEEAQEDAEEAVEAAAEITGEADDEAGEDASDEDETKA